MTIALKLLGLVIESLHLRAVWEYHEKGSLYDSLRNETWNLNSVFTLSFIDDLLKVRKFSSVYKRFARTFILVYLRLMHFDVYCRRGLSFCTNQKLNFMAI